MAAKLTILGLEGDKNPLHQSSHIIVNPEKIIENNPQ